MQTLRVSALLLLAALFLLPSLAAFAQSAGEARDMARAALRLEFRRDGLTATDADLDERFAQACERGYAPACRRSSWLVAGRPDPRKVLQVLEPSCEAGDPVACLTVGWCLDLVAAKEHTSEERDRLYKRAAKLYKDLCDGGDQAACHEYASSLYFNGLSPDPRPGLARWRTACDAGQMSSCATLAKLNRDGGDGVPVNRKLAHDYAERACDAGYAEGCRILGDMEDASWDAVKLDSFYGELCDAGHRESCWRLARIYYDGIHPEPTPGRLMGLFVRACDLGHARSCFEAGRMNTDESQAATLYGRACALGDPAGCSAQVDSILAQRSPGSVKTATHAFEVACEVRQSASACTALAYALLAGTDIPRDAERGRALLTLTCTDDVPDPEACFTLGRVVEEGVGGERDRTEASKYYRWACTAGHVESCVRRGDLLTSDVGVRRDDHEALNMYQRACDGGHADACTKAGVILDEATYVTEDRVAALALYEQACAGGSPTGCTRLGLLREKGQAGVGPDMSGARDAYERAITLGSLDAKRALARLLWQGYGGPRKHGRAKQLCREACQSGDPVACRGPAFL
jgi:TPR repeat protein